MNHKVCKRKKIKILIRVRFDFYDNEFFFKN